MVSVDHREPRAGDRWLLCSDGVTGYVPEPDIERLLSAATAPSRAAADIVALALDAGTRDNATAVVCDVVESEADGSAPVFSGSAARHFAEDVETA